MEEEKKKKKNKKKKNKQTKTTGSDNIGAAESSEGDRNHVLEHNHQNQVSEIADEQEHVQKTDADLGRRQVNGAEDVSLEERIKKICKENEIHLKEKDILEESIKRLQEENDKHLQNEASLEVKILQLQSEKDSWISKEAGFEEKINQLIRETTTLNLKGVSFEEKVKQLERERDFWIQKEVLTKETIVGLTNENSRLQAQQVMELEGCRNCLSQENQQLMETIANLQLQVHNFDKNTAANSVTPVSGEEDMNTQMEAACALVEKLIVENAELVEKVNELYIELNQQGMTAELYPAVGSDLSVGTSDTVQVADSIILSGEGTSLSGEKMNLLEDIDIKGDRNDGDSRHILEIAGANSILKSGTRTSQSGKSFESLEVVAITDEEKGGDYNYMKEGAVSSNSQESINPEEIVQVSLDENEARDAVSQTTDHNENGEVPLTDAPLIGAPFRLISFVARYVSGADLVNKSSVE